MPPNGLGAYHRARHGAQRQRGFIALIVLLIVVVIVGFAISAMLRDSGAPRTDRSTQPASTGAPNAAATPIERARAVEETLRQQAAENERRIDQQVDGTTR